MGKKKVKKRKNESSMSISEEPKKQKKTKKSKKEKEKKYTEVKDVTPEIKIIDKKAVVDQHFADRAQYHICQDTDNEFNGKFFSCTLNKSDLDKNNNKFYIIQLLEHDSTNDLILFTGVSSFTSGDFFPFSFFDFFVFFCFFGSSDIDIDDSFLLFFTFFLPIISFI